MGCRRGKEEGEKGAGSSLACRINLVPGGGNRGGRGRGPIAEPRHLAGIHSFPRGVPWKMNGAGDGNRTHVAGLGSQCITIMLHPPEGQSFRSQSRSGAWSNLKTGVNVNVSGGISSPPPGNFGEDCIPHGLPSPGFPRGRPRDSGGVLGGGGSFWRILPGRRGGIGATGFRPPAPVFRCRR